MKAPSRRLDLSVILHRILLLIWDLLTFSDLAEMLMFERSLREPIHFNSGCRWEAGVMKIRSFKASKLPDVAIERK